VAVPADDGRTPRVAGAAGLALLLAVLAVLLEPADRRLAAAGLLALGLAAGGVLGARLPARRSRTMMERFNDAAFVVVLAAVSLLLVPLGRPWTAVAPGLVGGLLVGRAVTSRPPAEPPGPDPGPPEGNAGPQAS
jgi:peptidoglycan/LPS O-acetylase OafA/YrhL